MGSLSLMCSFAAERQKHVPRLVDRTAVTEGQSRTQPTKSKSKRTTATPTMRPWVKRLCPTATQSIASVASSGSTTRGAESFRNTQVVNVNTLAHATPSLVLRGDKSLSVDICLCSSTGACVYPGAARGWFVLVCFASRRYLAMRVLQHQVHATSQNL